MCYYIYSHTASYTPDIDATTPDIDSPSIDTLVPPHFYTLVERLFAVPGGKIGAWIVALPLYLIIGILICTSILDTWYLAVGMGMFILILTGLGHAWSVNTYTPDIIDILSNPGDCGTLWFLPVRFRYKLFRN